MARTRVLILVAVLLVGCSEGRKTITPVVPPPVHGHVPCVMTLTWTLPVEYESGAVLFAVDIDALTVYAGRIPDAPEGELAFVEDIGPHALIHTWTWMHERGGLWYFQGTVTVGDVESRRSNEVMKECTVDDET